MDFIWFLLIGAVAGWLAGLLIKSKKSGLLRNIVVGVVGAMIGGWLFPKLGIQFAGLVGSIVMATGGAVLLLFSLRLLAPSKG